MVLERYWEQRGHSFEKVHITVDSVVADGKLN